MDDLLILIILSIIAGFALLYRYYLILDISDDNNSNDSNDGLQDGIDINDVENTLKRKHTVGSNDNNLSYIDLLKLLANTSSSQNTVNNSSRQYTTKTTNNTYSYQLPPNH